MPPRAEPWRGDAAAAAAAAGGGELYSADASAIARELYGGAAGSGAETAGAAVI